MNFFLLSSSASIPFLAERGILRSLRNGASRRQREIISTLVTNQTKNFVNYSHPNKRGIDYRIDLTENGNHENEPTTTLGKNTGEPEEPKTQYVSTQIENPSGNEMKLLKEVALLKETIRRKNQRISKLRNYVLQLKSQAKENIMSIVKKSAKMKFYTGLPNVESFEGLHELASPMIRKSGMAK